MFFCFQAEDGRRELVRSRGLGDVYKRQEQKQEETQFMEDEVTKDTKKEERKREKRIHLKFCFLKENYNFSLACTPRGYYQ